MMDYTKIFERFNGNPPLDMTSIDLIQKESGTQMPSDYLDFLQFANGGEGWIGDFYIILWRFDHLFQMNDSYNAKEYIPELLLIGSDGGGEAYAFDHISIPWKVVRSPFVGMDRKSVVVIASSFKEFLAKLSTPGIRG